MVSVVVMSKEKTMAERAKRIEITTVFKKCRINDLSTAVTMLLYGRKDSRLRAKTTNQIVFERRQKIDGALRTLLQMADSSITERQVPYEQVVDFDRERESFTVQGSCTLHQYRLDVTVMYRQDKQNVICKGLIVLSGVRNKAARELAATFIINEFKRCRKEEACEWNKMLKRKPTTK